MRGRIALLGGLSTWWAPALGGCPLAPQYALSCECSGVHLGHNRTRLGHTARTMPRCTASRYCGHANSMTSEDVTDGIGIDNASFLIIYSYKKSQVRYWYKGDPFRSYLNAMRLIVRLLLSLHAVGTQLPIHLLLLGERHRDFESALLERFPQLGLLEGSTLVPEANRIRVPCVSTLVDTSIDEPAPLHGVMSAWLRLDHDSMWIHTRPLTTMPRVCYVFALVRHIQSLVEPISQGVVCEAACTRGHPVSAHRVARYRHARASKHRPPPHS